MKALLLAALVVATPAHGALWCDIESKFQCGPEGCSAVTPTIDLSIELETNTYLRCDNNGCDQFGIILGGGQGQYTILDMPGRGAFAKLSPDSTRVTEVVSLGEMVLVSYGACGPGPPPVSRRPTSPR